MGKLSCLILGILLFQALIMLSDARRHHRSKMSTKSSSRTGSRMSTMTGSRTGSKMSTTSSSRTGSRMTTSSTSRSTSDPPRSKVSYCWRNQQVWCRKPAYVRLVNKQCSCACKYGLSYSTEIKRCICPAPGQVFDRRQKECRCMSGLKFDSGLNACVCSNTCEPPLVINPKSCNCECTERCEPPFILDPKACACICPAELVPNKDKTDCVCPLEGHVLDPKLGCVCTGDLVEDKDEGACVCPDCIKGFTLDQEGDKCNCTCSLTCPGNFTLNEELCLCECPPGAVYDSRINDCVCLGDQIFNPVLDSCECKGADMVFNEDTEMCECVPCPEDYVAQIEGDNCKCICISESCEEAEPPTSN